MFTPLFRFTHVPKRLCMSFVRAHAHGSPRARGRDPLPAYSRLREIVKRALHNFLPLFGQSHEIAMRPWEDWRQYIRSVSVTGLFTLCVVNVIVVSRLFVCCCCWKPRPGPWPEVKKGII